jgi:hypothetical protein
MAPFTTPRLLPHPLALPAADTPLTEEALLLLLRSHLRPLEALTVTLNTALEHEDLTYKVTGPLLDVLWESLYALVHLLDAWWDQQPVERLVSEGEDARP